MPSSDTSLRCPRNSDSAQTNFTYDDEGRLTAAGGSSITYDTAGRTKTYNGWLFEYDPEGRLLRACKSSSCSGAGFDKLEFTYDGEGHRTRIVATAAGGAVTTTKFRHQGDAVVEEKVDGIVTKTFVVDEAGAIVKMTVPSGGNAGDYLVSWNGHGDALHLLRIKSDGTAELANSFSYSTWGTPSVDGSHINSATGGAYGDLGFRYLYVGQFDVQWDNTFGLGLHYMHARHYAPALGRFLQPDPDGLEDSLYAYAANNPVTEIDPDGTCIIICQVLVGAILGAAIETATYLATTDSSQWDFGAAVSSAASGAVLGAATSIGIGALGLAGRAAMRATSTAARAVTGAARNVASQASRGLVPQRLALASPRGPQWPRWSPQTKPPTVTRLPPLRPTANPAHGRVLDTLRGMNPNLTGGGPRLSLPRWCTQSSIRLGLCIAPFAIAVGYRLSVRRE